MLIVDDIEQKRPPLTFSLTMLRERIQRLLNFCSPAAVPTEWNVQLFKFSMIMILIIYRLWSWSFIYYDHDHLSSSLRGCTIIIKIKLCPRNGTCNWRFDQKHSINAMIKIMVILWEQFRYFNLFKSYCIQGDKGGSSDIFSFFYLEI